MGISSALEITHGKWIVIPENSETETVIVQITKSMITIFASSFNIKFSNYFFLKISLTMFGIKSISIRSHLKIV